MTTIPIYTNFGRKVQKVALVDDQFARQVLWLAEQCGGQWIYLAEDRPPFLNVSIPVKKGYRKKYTPLFLHRFIFYLATNDVAIRSEVHGILDATKKIQKIKFLNGNSYDCRIENLSGVMLPRSAQKFEDRLEPVPDREATPVTTSPHSFGDPDSYLDELNQLHSQPSPPPPSPSNTVPDGNQVVNSMFRALDTTLDGQEQDTSKPISGRQMGERDDH